jgi:hypothetical protein
MIRRRIAIAVCTALLAVGVGAIAPASAGAHATSIVPHLTVNGCTVNSSSVSLLPKPKYTLKPGVGFTINCLTLTSWTLNVQCQVSPDGNSWSQCANTSEVQIQERNSGGNYIILVGNGSWGCSNTHVYRGKVYMGGGSVQSVEEVPQPAWNCP